MPITKVVGALLSLFRSHGPSVASIGGRHSSGGSSSSRGERRRSDPLQEMEVNSAHLGINKAAISHFSIGHHRWTRVSLLNQTGCDQSCVEADGTQRMINISSIMYGRIN